jgi:hypothetical protein
MMVLPLLVLFLGSTAAQTAFSTDRWQGIFAAGSGVLESLRPTQELDFDFSPSDVFSTRNGNGNSHTGDVSFRYRVQGQESWLEADSWSNRTELSSSQPQNSQDLLQSDFDSLWPAVSKSLHVERLWTQYDGDLILNITMTNVDKSPIEVGALGLAIEMNNIFVNRTADQTMQKCVLVDPYIGLGAGYVQATRLTGTGPNLVITPFGNVTKFEAWRFLPEPTNQYYQIQTYEGNYAYMIYTEAYAEQEWNTSTPWNAPTSATISPGSSLSVALRFSTASSVENIEERVASNDIPVAVGIPGYVLPRDIIGSLFLNTTDEVTSMNVSPDDALSVAPKSDSFNEFWKGYTVTPSESAFGRVNLHITYRSGRTQAIHYWVADTGPSTLKNLGDFLTTNQWYTDISDPFNRAPSIIAYNYTAMDYVLQDNRAWIAGISDEGGAGSFLAAAMKQLIYPSANEVSKLEQMVNQTVWGDLQIASGPQQYAVRKSLFYYQPSALPGYKYSNNIHWDGTWDKAAAYLTDRAYDYVHVSALYYALYHAGTVIPNLLEVQTSHWYLLQAYHTVAYCFSTNATTGRPLVGYGDDGLMGETVWLNLLKSLYVENFSTEAEHMRAIMQDRQKVWAGETDPFGSEMAWDSTGQEGVYLWSTYFNDSATANKSVNSIRGFMPTVPHWAWNGNARRYWDFLYAGGIPRIERQIHHYGSGLNSLPLLSNFRRSPEPESDQALYDLRVAFGGNMGPLSNVHADGFASLAMHSYPEYLHWDPYSGDYGPNFSGMVLGAGTYLVKHPIFSWIAMGGNIVEETSSGTAVTVQPRDVVRRRIYVAPLGAFIQLSAGQIMEFVYDPSAMTLSVSIGQATIGDAGKAPGAVMEFEQSSAVLGDKKVVLQTTGLSTGRGGYVVELPVNGTTTVEFGVT